MSPRELSLDHGEEHTAAADLIDCARQVEDATRRLAHLSQHAPDLVPADVDVVIGHIAETIATLPQVASQLAHLLEQSQHTHTLAMDTMTATTDPDLALDTARHHLVQLRDPAVEAYRHLNAARHEVAHISATPHQTSTGTNQAAADTTDQHPSRRDRPEHRQPPRTPEPGRRGPAI